MAEAANADVLLEDNCVAFQIVDQRLEIPQNPKPALGRPGPDNVSGRSLFF